MKMIMAIIKIDKVNETKQALSDAGFPSFWATGRVFGRGKGKWDAKVLEGAKNDQPEALSILGPEPRLRPQRLISLIVKQGKVKAAVKAIIDANRDNTPGDGKIFVLPMNDAITVRTGGSGETELD